MESASPAVRILIADEHAGFRRALRDLLEAQGGVVVAAETSDAEAIPLLLARSRPQVLLVSSALAANGACGHRPHPAAPPPPVRRVVMAAALDRAHIVEAVRAGAVGIIHKQAGPREYLECIRAAAGGRYSMNDVCLAVLVETLRESLAKNGANGGGKTQGVMAPLTPREIEIVRKVAAGLSNKELGEAFHISERTVKNHITTIFGKVGVSSRLGLAVFALNNHLSDGMAPGSNGGLPARSGN